MPRIARVFVENACNHVIARGNEKADIFRAKDDFRTYFLLLHKYKLKYGCLVYGYCLMPNHVHLIMESPSGLKGMSRFMHDVNQSYAMYFNIKYDRVGHLWQNRYKSLVVLRDRYLHNLVAYIENNPVRAGIVSVPEDYQWSSYRARVLGAHSIILDSFAAGDRTGDRAWGSFCPRDTGLLAGQV
ncbi:MAG: transposase [Candidatus Omnitrophica bacterium]|nr:transposase [Candidatus Omnitrophota bacterium]